MCIAAPGKVIEIQGKKAIVSYPGNEKRQAFISDGKVKVGSYVLVQMGIIIQTLSKKDAKTSLKAWNQT
jgi:hydrogenase expression/formation protein HypC